MTSRAARKTLVYDFETLAGYLLGRDALEKPLIGRLRFMRCRLNFDQLVVWLRDQIGDVELANGLESELDGNASEYDQMVVVRRFIFNRWKQYQDVLESA